MTPEVARLWAAERAHLESKLVRHASEFERADYEARLAQRYYEEMTGEKPENGR